MDTIYHVKSAIFKKDGKFKVYSDVYDAQLDDPPMHVSLVNKAIKDGYTDHHFIAIATSTWIPFTTDIYPDLPLEDYKKVKELIRKDVLKRFKRKLKIQMAKTK